MRHNVIGVRELPVEGNSGEGDAARSADGELQQEGLISVIQTNSGAHFMVMPAHIERIEILARNGHVTVTDRGRPRVFNLLGRE